MPITPVIPRNSVPLNSTSTRTYNFSSQLPTQYEESTGNNSPNEKLSQKRSSGSLGKPNLSARHLSASSPLAMSLPQGFRRPTTNDRSMVKRRSNTDGQSVTFLSNNLKQQLSIQGTESDNSATSNSQQRSQSPPPKPKSTLPQSTCQQGYVTASRLFNMMAYGLDNQYLMMHAHYLYIIDCRSREKFNDNHIVTAIHWEDALNGNVYISIVERFSEIVLYDDKGIFFNTTTEMRRVSSRFAPLSSKSCLSLAGGFEAFRTSYPFICTQLDIRSTVDREKYLTIYPSVILDGQLYLGTGHQATNWKVVRDLKLTHMINVSVEHQCVFVEKIKYLHIELEDKEDVSLKDRFDEAINFMNMTFQNSSNRMLVHCNLGISRSSTLILAYLMKIYNATLYEAYKFLRSRRPIISPNLGFLQQLVDYEYDLFSYNYTDPNDPIFH